MDAAAAGVTPCNGKLFCLLGKGPALGRAEAPRRLDEVSNMLTDVRRELLGSARR
jgi:hypothetical protein